MSSQNTLLLEHDPEVSPGTIVSHGKPTEDPIDLEEDLKPSIVTLLLEIPYEQWFDRESGEISTTVIDLIDTYYKADGEDMTETVEAVFEVGLAVKQVLSEKRIKWSAKTQEKKAASKIRRRLERKKIATDLIKDAEAYVGASVYDETRYSERIKEALKQEESPGNIILTAITVGYTVEDLELYFKDLGLNKKEITRFIALTFGIVAQVAQHKRSLEPSTQSLEKINALNLSMESYYKETKTELKKGDHPVSKYLEKALFRTYYGKEGLMDSVYKLEIAESQTEEAIKGEPKNSKRFINLKNSIEALVLLGLALGALETKTGIISKKVNDIIAVEKEEPAITTAPESEPLVPADIQKSVTITSETSSPELTLPKVTNHTVVEGDTIWSIATNLGMTSNEIMNAVSNIKHRDPDKIYPKEKVTITYDSAKTNNGGYSIALSVRS